MIKETRYDTHDPLRASAVELGRSVSRPIGGYSKQAGMVKKKGEIIFFSARERCKGM
jgi:hypothetical protein